MPADPFPGETPRTDTPAPRRWIWLRRLGRFGVVVLALLGPWPVDNAPYRGTWYEAKTLERLRALPGVGRRVAGPIRVGVGEADLTPGRPTPLAGFSNQAGRPFGSIDTRCKARAVTVESAGRKITVVTADLLLVNAEVAAMVADAAEVEPDDLFFTASHTHGGPGGWGRHPLERIVAGRFDADDQERIAHGLVDAVRKSRAELVPAEVGLAEASPAGRQKNRVVPGAPTHDALSALVFRDPGAGADAPPLAILAVFGAHATVVRADPPRLSADYPGALVGQVRERTGAGMVLFAAGAVGDAAPERPNIPAPTKAAAALGRLIGDDLVAALPGARFSATAVVERVRLPVDLPPVRMAFFSPWLRFSPMATWWIADRQTHLDALRIGPAVLVGFPGDEAGHLAAPIVDRARREKLGFTPVVTSFNGDYRGYFESAAIYFDRSCYETRWMNFYGPWLGEYLGSVADAVLGDLAGRDPAPPQPRPRLARTRRALTIILLGVGLAGLLGPGRRLAVGSRRAFTAAAGFAVAAIVSPHLLDSARFGLGLGAVGAAAVWGAFALGLVGPLRGWVERRGIGRPRLGWFLGVALVSGSWPVALAGLWWAAGFPGKLPDPAPVSPGVREDGDEDDEPDGAYQSK